MHGGANVWMNKCMGELCARRGSVKCGQLRERPERERHLALRERKGREGKERGGKGERSRGKTGRSGHVGAWRQVVGNVGYIPGHRRGDDALPHMLARAQPSADRRKAFFALPAHSVAHFLCCR